MHHLHRTLSRRTFLRGLGVSIGLPVLDAMLPAGCSDPGAYGDSGATRRGGDGGSTRDGGNAATAWSLGRSGPPVRLVIVTVSSGFNGANWVPVDRGRDYTLSPHLASIAPDRGDYTVVSGLSNDLGPSTGAFHTRGTATHLTSMPVDRTVRSGGTSVDQVAASVIGTTTPFASLELGTVPVRGVALNCDGAWECAWGDNISWAGPQRPMPKDADPRSVFDRLFGTGDPIAAARVRSRRQSILDYVSDDANRVGARLGAADRARIEEYLTAVRAAERMVAASMVPEAGARPDEGLDLGARLRAMFELTALALQSDATRVVTLMHGCALFQGFYPWLGIDPSLGGHHKISHTEGDPRRLAAQTAIGDWEVQQFAQFVSRLKGIDEAGAPLLDRTVVLFTSELLDGNAHVSTDLPVLLAGSAGGALHTGSHVRVADGTSLAKLHKTLLTAVGVGVDRFGLDGTDVVSGLLV